METQRLTPASVISALATRAGLNEVQVKLFLQAQAEMAYTHADVGFPLAGIGVVQLIAMPAKTMENKFGPRKGQSVQLPARKKLVFRYTEAAKAALVGKGAPVPNVVDVDWYPAEEDFES